MEATAAAEKTEASQRLAAASAEKASSREQMQQKSTELARREEAIGKNDRVHSERRAKTLVRYCGARHSLCSIPAPTEIFRLISIERQDKSHTLFHGTLVQVA